MKKKKQQMAREYELKYYLGTLKQKNQQEQNEQK